MNRVRACAVGGSESLLYAIVGKGGIICDSAYTNTSLYTRGERRSRIILGGNPVNNIRLVYANLYVQAGEINGPNTITIEAGLERTSPAQTVLFTFGGQPTITLAPGEYAITDPIPASAFSLTEYPASMELIARTGVTFDSGGTFIGNPTATWVNPSGQSGVVGFTGTSSSQISGTGALTTPAGGAANFHSVLQGPQAVIGQWTKNRDISLMVNGTSIATRLDDVNDTWSSGGGYIIQGTRSVASRTIPTVRISRSSENASHWANGATFRKFLMQYCTHYIDDFGTNDLATGRTAAQALADKQTIWADFKARAIGYGYIINTPVAPRVTSTDSYATLANQTPVSGFATGAARDTLNSSVLALVGASNGPDEIIDTNLDWADSVSLDKFPVTGAANYATDDGVHPTATLHTAAASRVATAAAKWRI